MSFSRRFVIALSSAFLLASPAFAASASNSVDSAVADTITAAVSKAFVGAKVTAMHATEMQGFTEVEINGNTSAYVDDEGKYLFLGSLYRLDGAKGATDLTEQRKEALRKTELAAVKPSTMVTYKADGKQKAQIYVFTDTTCGYCQRFHQEIDEITNMGVTVHYLAFPRAGVNSRVGKVMDAVWCAKDSNTAMTEAKLGDASKAPAQNPLCSSPVASEYQLGVRLGVTGTPAIYTVDGKQIGGYLPPKKLAARLGLKG